MPFIYALCMLLGGMFLLVQASLLVTSFSVFLLAAYKKWRLTQIISAVGFFAALATGTLFVYIFVLDPAPEGIFVSAFERPVPGDVKNLKCHTLWIGDCFITWLRFETNETEFRALVPAELTKKTDDYRTFIDETGGPNAPDWWKPEAKGDFSYYSVRRDHGRIHPSESIFMAYDQENHSVYYFFVGWS